MRFAALDLIIGLDPKVDNLSQPLCKLQRLGLFISVSIGFAALR
jgi:hypothetical protein